MMQLWNYLFPCIMIATLTCVCDGGTIDTSTVRQREGEIDLTLGSRGLKIGNRFQLGGERHRIKKESSAFEGNAIRDGTLAFDSNDQADQLASMLSASMPLRFQRDANLDSMRPSVRCTDDSMTLRVKGLNAPHAVMVDSGEGSLTPLTQMPSHCGFSVKRSRRSLLFVAPYKGCHVTQQGGNYVLPLVLWGSPMKMSCPVAVPPQTSATCYQNQMVLKLGGATADAVAVQVSGKWEPLRLSCSHCGFAIEPLDGGPGLTITSPYGGPCMEMKNNEHVLSLRLDDKQLIVSCPSLPVSSVKDISADEMPNPTPTAPPSKTKSTTVAPVKISRVSPYPEFPMNSGHEHWPPMDPHWRSHPMWRSHPHLNPHLAPRAPAPDQKPTPLQDVTVTPDPTVTADPAKGISTTPGRIPQVPRALQYPHAMPPYWEFPMYPGSMHQAASQVQTAVPANTKGISVAPVEIPHVPLYPQFKSASAAASPVATPDPTPTAAPANAKSTPMASGNDPQVPPYLYWQRFPHMPPYPQFKTAPPAASQVQMPGPTPTTALVDTEVTSDPRYQQFVQMHRYWHYHPMPPHPHSFNPTTSPIKTSKPSPTAVHANTKDTAVDPAKIPWDPQYPYPWQFPHVPYPQYKSAPSAANTVQTLTPTPTAVPADIEGTSVGPEDIPQAPQYHQMPPYWQFQPILPYPVPQPTTSPVLTTKHTPTAAVPTHAKGTTEDPAKTPLVPQYPYWQVPPMGLYPQFKMPVQSPEPSPTAATSKATATAGQTKTKGTPVAPEFDSHNWEASAKFPPGFGSWGGPENFPPGFGSGSWAVHPYAAGYYAPIPGKTAHSNTDR